MTRVCLVGLMNLVVWHVAANGVLRADGMPIENGRFTGGPATVIALTPAQAAELKAAEGRNEDKILVLTEDQRTVLRKSAGVAPRKLFIYNTRKGENDCTCEAANRGLWFADGKVEVPHAYLVAEAGAAELPTNRPLIGAIIAVAGAVTCGAFMLWRRGRAGVARELQRPEDRGALKSA